MEWYQIAGQTGYLDLSYSLIGVYWLRQGEIVLIDSGPHPSDRLLEAIAQRGLRVRGVLCTHLHPDHIGNNELLKDRFDAEIFADSREIVHALECGWPLGTEELRALDLKTITFHPKAAPPYPMTPISQGQQTLLVEGAAFQILPTPGHTPGHIAIVTPDNVCFAGDAAVSEAVLARSKLPYYERVGTALQSMARLRQTDFSAYAVAHKAVVGRDRWGALLDANMQKEQLLKDELMQLAAAPTALETLLERYAAALEISHDITQSPILHTSLRDRVLELAQAGELTIRDGIVSLPDEGPSARP